MKARYAISLTGMLLFSTWLGFAGETEMRKEVLSIGELVAAPVIRDSQGNVTPIHSGDLTIIYFDALPCQEKPTRVFAWVGIPKTASPEKKVPGIVLVHGGGGTAFKEWVQKWVAQGFAAISIAVEGQTDRQAPKTPGNQDSPWQKHAWSGPQRSGIYADSDRPLKDQWMYHAVADTVLANSLMRSLPMVDADQVGVMGISWGGIVTSTVIGIDRRFAFAIPTYGCGNLAEAANQYGTALGKNDLYKQVWDPMVRMPSVKTPTLWLSWPGDVHFPLDAQAANYQAMPGPYMVCLIPGMKHSHQAGWNPPDSYAFAQSIVEDGKPWARQLDAKTEADVFTATFESAKPLQKAVLVSTKDKGFTGKRVWTEAPATLEEKNGKWLATARLPDGTTAWFVNLASGNLTLSSDFMEAGKNKKMNTTTGQTRQNPADNMDATWGDAAKPEQGNVDRLQWLRDGKYSMFIHWGLYSHLGGAYRGKTYRGIGEWIMHEAMAGIPVEEYKALAKDFNPVKFDAQAIVKLARDAGMRCIVITAKHHEGFAMFDSAASDFTITKASPFKRDPLKELAAACQAAGIRLGFYYSQFQDWVEPDAGRSPDFNHYFERKAFPQIKELLTNYGPISVVWFDTPGSMGKEHSQRLVDLVHELQPGCLVNSRVGNGLGDYSTLGDMEIPTKTPEDGGLYESIETTNDSWAWSKTDAHWKSPRTIARSLVRTVARGCSFMLNIGPKDDGSVPEESAHALREVGQWIQRHAEAVYETSASPFPPFSWGDCTVKGHDLFVHIFDWPRSNTIRMAALKGRVEKATLMATGEAVSFSQTDDLLTLRLPSDAPESLISVVRLTLDAEPRALHHDLTVDGQSPTLLRAEYSATSGVREKRERWMETFGEWKTIQTLTEWKDAEACASWPIEVLAPGAYMVRIEYACGPEAEGAEWVLESNGKKLTFATLDTGMRPQENAKRRRMRFRTVEVGLLQLGTSGRQTLQLHPSSVRAGSDVWFSQITITPWE